MSRLADRGAEYFGISNVAALDRVRLGHKCVAFVGPERLWLYEERFGEDGPKRGMVVNLSPTMRANLLKALGGYEIPPTRELLG